MLLALLTRESLSAGELARRVGLSASGASNHLRRLESSGLITVERAGRNRYIRLADATVAEALEELARIAAPPKVRDLRQAEAARALHRARTCYDHLAGKLGVSLTQALLEREILVAESDRFDLTCRGEAWLARHAIDVSALQQGRRSFARACLDWTERQPHLAGSLGAALTTLFFNRRWITRRPASRAVHITAAGASWLEQEFSITALGLDEA